MKSPLHGRCILLGVTGSIAAYKAAYLASRLTQEGAQVITLMTPSATRFITPLTFRALTGQPAYTQEDLWGPEANLLHIRLAQKADAMLVVPCTAETLAQLALGHANTLVSLAALALGEKPLFIAPAMDGEMFAHPQVQTHLNVLRARGAYILGPVKGRLASGLVAYGRMVEPETIQDIVRQWFAQRYGPLRGRRVVVTAGPTWEAVDAVRVFTNRSSGKQGYALAEVARDLGAEVVLISGPTLLPAPHGVKQVMVESAREMLDALLAHAREADILLKAAAVADYRPARRQQVKVKKGKPRWHITLTANPDLLSHIQALRQEQGRPRWVVGFAAESGLLVEEARRKLKQKGLDLILLNDITQPDAGFRVDTNQGVILDRFGHDHAFPVLPKGRVAELLLAWVLLLEQGYSLWHVAPWEAVQQARREGFWEPPSGAAAVLLARREQLPDLARRLYPDVPPDRLLALGLDMRDWTGRWSWTWEEDEWWAILPAEPIPWPRLRIMPYRDILIAEAS